MARFIRGTFALHVKLSLYLDMPARMYSICMKLDYHLHYHKHDSLTVFDVVVFHHDFDLFLYVLTQRGH